MQVRNKKWTEEQLFRKRKEIVARWPTGAAIDLDEAVEYRKAQPLSKNWIEVLRKAREEDRILVSCFVGHATLEDTLDHLQYLEQCGAELLHILPDTYTRRARYKDAEGGLRASLEGRSVLNGYPVVNYGIQRARYIREHTWVPIVIHNADGEYCELTTEMSLAAGFDRSTGDVETALRSGIKSMSLEEKILENQYMNRLTAYYAEKSGPIMTLMHNCFAGLDPAEIKVAQGVLHALLCAEQGVRHLSQELALACHLIQDVAGLRSVKQLTEEYLNRFGYAVDVTMLTYPWASVWPRDPSRAAATGALNAMISVLAGVNWFEVKSFHEAISVPNSEANARAMRAAQHIVNVMGRQRLEHGPELTIETEMITYGARAIIEKTLELGDGDAAIGQIRAVELGIIDTAFSPYAGCKGKTVPLRDATGAIRYADPGNVPLPIEVVEYHREKLAQRERAEPNRKRYEMMLQDIYYLAGEAPRSST